jgi:hypothetical protein
VITPPRDSEFPIVGGCRERPFACVFVAGSKDGRAPVKIGACVRLRMALADLSDKRVIINCFWVPSYSIAKRVALAARRIFGVTDINSDGWVTVNAAAALDAIHEGARKEHVPLLADKDYRSLLTTQVAWRHDERRLTKNNPR